MLSLFLVCCGKENFYNFLDFFKEKTNALVQQYHARFYNIDKLDYRAEAHPELLRRNSRFALPTDRATYNFYFGYLNFDNDWDALYAKLFACSPIGSETYPGPPCYYSALRLNSLLRQFAKTPYEKTDTTFYDFAIEYQFETPLDDPEKLCIIRIDMNSVVVDAFEFLQHIVSVLDHTFPDVFTSAYIDDYEYSDERFDKERLKEKILRAGKAFYVSERLAPRSNLDKESVRQKYQISPMENGTFLTLSAPGKPEDDEIAPINDLLIPRYLVTDWRSLCDEHSFPLTRFDTLSVYYNKYFPTNPELLFSGRYTTPEIEDIAKERALTELQARYKFNWSKLD